MTKISNSVALGRVSTAEQRKSGSLTRQETNVYKMADEMNAPVIKYWDEDISSKIGKNFRRRDLVEIYEFCKKNKTVRYLIIDEVDRFMRDIEVMFYWRVKLREELRVKQVFADKPELNEETSQARLLIALDAFKAEASNEERQRKSINGHIAAIKQGRYTFPPKPGYIKSGVPGVHGPHPVTFGPIQIALREVVNGIFTPTESLKRLNSSEFTKIHSPWRMDKFRKYATDSYYAGIVEKDKQVQAKNENGQHQAMITVEEHEKLQIIFQRGYVPRGARKQYNPEFPMAKILLCEDCRLNAKFTGAFQSNGKGKKYPKYRCRGCGKQYHRAEIHEGINDHLTKIGYNGTQQKDFLRALGSVWQDKKKDSVKDQKSLEKRMGELRATKSNLIRALAEADPTNKGDIQYEIDSIRNEIAETDQQIDKMDDLTDDLLDFVEFALNYTDELKNDWWQLSGEERQKCQQLLFPAGISFNSAKKVRTPKITPLYSVETNKKDLRIDRKSLMVELRGIAPLSVRSQNYPSTGIDCLKFLPKHLKTVQTIFGLAPKVLIDTRGGASIQSNI